MEKDQIAAKEKAKQDVAEQAQRVVQLQETISVFKTFSEQMYEMKLEKRAKQEVRITTF